MSTSYHTPSYFHDFSCLGDKCEDTCCRNWEVKLDRNHYDLLKIEMSKDNHENSMFEQYIHLNDKSITSDHDYAFIRMGVNNYCAMLDDKGLCSIHANHGVSALGNVCTMFPRVISRCGPKVELSGALSCPEVVRKCINDLKPLKLKRFKPSELPRSKNYPIQRELSDLEDDFYSKYFYIVREKLMAIMADEDHILETRLYVVANLSHKISEFYYRGCQKLEKTQLEEVMLSLSENDFIMKMNSFISDYDVGPTSMIVVNSILQIKLQQANSENISQLYQRIIDSCASNSDNIAETLVIQLAEVKQSLCDEELNAIDKAITRYIINCLYREWFISMPDSFTYIQMILVRSSILRTLIYLDIGQQNNLSQSELKEKIVYVIYNFARNIDQNLDFLKLVYNALSEQSMLNFDFSPAFIRI